MLNRSTVFWIVLALILEKTLQHGVTALLLVISINGIGRPDIGNLLPLGYAAVAVLNCVVMVLFILGFLYVWELRAVGLHIVIILSLFDIAAEFLIHGFAFVTLSVIVATMLILFSLILRKSGFGALGPPSS